MTDPTQQAQEKLREAAIVLFRMAHQDGTASTAAELDRILGYSELLQQKEELLGALQHLRTKAVTFAGAHSSAHLSESQYRRESWDALLAACTDAEAAIARAKGGK